MEPRKLPDAKRKTALSTRELLLLLCILVAALIFVFYVFARAVSGEFNGHD